MYENDSEAKALIKVYEDLTQKTQNVSKLLFVCSWQIVCDCSSSGTRGKRSSDVIWDTSQSMELKIKKKQINSVVKF